MAQIPETKPEPTHRDGLRRIARKRIGWALEYAWELSGSVRLYRADALLIEGTERKSGSPLRAWYFGHYDNYAFIFGRMCSEHRVVEKHSGINSARVNHWLTRYRDSVSLVCLDVELLFCKMLSVEKFLQVPQWVRQKLTLPDRWDEVLGCFRSNTKKTDLRKVRKYGFGYRTSRTEEDFNDFYERMYVPYIRRRFGDEALIEPRWKVLRQCRKGELMHIVRDGKVVAAVLLHLSEGRLAYVWVGVPDESVEGLQNGAFSAMYYFTILHAYRLGCSGVDFLGSRPLLNDGLFRYKRKWGTYVEDSPMPRGDILLQPVEFTVAVRSYFAEHPFIVRRGKEFVGKVLLGNGASTGQDLQKVYDQLHTDGLQRLQIYSLSGFAPDARDWERSGTAAVELHDLGAASTPEEEFCRT